ncbi:MAG: hypothetical protein WDM81_09460 [Rhizomicrobium sp.]
MSVAQSALAGLMGLAGRAMPDFVRFDSGTPCPQDALLCRRSRRRGDRGRRRCGGGHPDAAFGRAAAGARRQPRGGGPALVGFLHQKFADKTKAPDMRGQFEASPTSAKGFQRTRDGRFVFLHRAFPEKAPRGCSRYWTVLTNRRP